MDGEKMIQSNGPRLHRFFRHLKLGLLFILLGSWQTPSSAEVNRIKPKVLPINRPIQITFDADPLLYAAVSSDGKRLVYASGQEGFADLWLRSADPSVVVLPRRLTSDPANETAPALSPDGKLIAYVGTGHDAKGDIYLLDLEKKDAVPERLTGRETADGAPCFSPDGKRLYFHQIPPGGRDRRLVTLDIEQPMPHRARELRSIGGDGSFPAVSPDGRMLAFVTFRDDPGGDIFIFDLSKKEVFPLTHGAARDLYPVWSPDGASVYFTRFALDTNQDGTISLKDHAVICRIRPGAISSQAYPLTSASASSFQPKVAGSRLFYLSAREGTSNLWSLPLDGIIPTKEDPSKQLDLALEVAAQIPLDPYLALLSYYRILEVFPDQKPFAARASYEIGRIYLDLRLPDAAEEAFRRTGETYSQTVPEAPLARIETLLIRIRRAWRKSDDSEERAKILDTGLSQLKALSTRYASHPSVQARAAIARAGLLMELGKDPASLTRAIGILEEAAQRYASEPEQAAEALVMRADAYSRVGRSQDVLPAYTGAIDRFPDQERWGDLAVQRILDLAVKDFSSTKLDDRIAVLRRIVEENRLSRPRLAFGALNRIGDLYFSSGEWSKAKQAYRQVLDAPSEREKTVVPPEKRDAKTQGGTTQRAAARLALAEILYKEERFRQALDLYEREILARPYEDHIYRLARHGYIRKSIAAGEFLYRIGEVASARKIFKDLIKEDPSIIEAHRGYIKCAATQKEVQGVLAQYEAQSVQSPDDPIGLYANALCLTYLDDKRAMERARSLLLRAIDVRGQIEYFHQTLGYVLEVLETVYKERGGLELAAESYQRAYFLNKQGEDEGNKANLLLNLGNVHYLLGHYPSALRYYSLRLETEAPFEREDTEILFYRRLGAAAFHIRDPEKSIRAFERALDLIDARMHPRKASDALDRISRYMLDRIVTPALRNDDGAQKAKEIAEKQSRINRELVKLTQPEVKAPPDPRWEAYRQGIEALLSKQETLNTEAVSLAEFSLQSPESVRQTLDLMASRVRAALDFPERLIHLKAELLDRLGLAYQEAGRWRDATEAFKAVFTLNKALGLNQNLAANRRSVAYNTYQQASEYSGGERKRLLEEAAEGFREVVALVREYGVAEKREEEKGEALISLTYEVSLDKSTASEAMYGFSAAQEERLADAFLSRIMTELGDLDPAWKATVRQLEEYPIDRPIPDKDVYGVSLLYHRAGHLAIARELGTEAFEYYRRSAELSLRMGTPVSTATNVINMAHVLMRVSPEKDSIVTHWGVLILYDTKATHLLERYPDVTGKPLVAGYHNAMGVHMMNLAASFFRAASSSPGREALMRKVVIQADALQRAGVHFALGLRWFDQQREGSQTRESSSLRAALRLNMANLSFELGEHAKATENLKAALERSREAFLPEFQWRALAGLGRLQEALETLRSQSILRVGCRDHEIVNVFAPMVEALVEADRPEEAFNLLERLSELERVNRMAPLVIRKITEKERKRCRDLYPRLERIRRLRAQAASAQGEQKSYLSESLDRERKLAASLMGERAFAGEWDAMARFSVTEEIQELIIIALGLAVHAEEVARSAVKEKDKGRLASLSEEYRVLVKRSRGALEEANALRPLEKPGGLMATLFPQPVEAVEVFESLPKGGKLIRFFGTQKEDGARYAFVLTPNEIRAVSLPAGEISGIKAEGPLYLSCEDLSQLPPHVAGIRALSATHLLRSIRDRKPFKRSLLVVAPGAAELANHSAYPSSYDAKVITTDAADLDILEALQGTHTLVLAADLSMASSVPTRTDERPSRSPAIHLDRGRRLPLTHFSGRLSNVSLSVLTGASLDDAYLIGHFFALHGCPTVLIPTKPQERTSFVLAFLQAYASGSVSEAMERTGSDPRVKGGWIALGYHGMTQKEAKAFAEAGFVRYVKEAMAAFKQKEYDRALPLLENAHLIARDVPAFRRHLPNIYRFSRESAYAVGKLDKAFYYAKLLVDLLGKEQPDSHAHAEALLRMGLLQAQMEQYDLEGGAVPTLNRVIDMLSRLDLGPEQAAALSDLGVVLENATEYDRALVRFEAAATLSRELNQREILARQYINIGRIYDLRLSRYAAAKQSYQRGLSILRELGDARGAAQVLLDIGRCHRHLGDFATADEHYLQAFALLKTAPGDGNRRLNGKILIERANNAWYQARYQDAFELVKSAYRIAREDDWALDEVIALNTSGLIWWTLGDNAKALRELDQALNLARRLKARPDEVASTLNNMGVVYREMEKYQEAMEVFEGALAIDRKLKSRWAIAYDLRNMGLTMIRMERPQEAIPLLKEAVSEAHDIGDRVNEAKSLLALGEAQLAVDKRTEAAASFQRADGLSRTMMIRETQWRAQHGLALVALKEQRRKDARKYLTDAAGVIEGMRAEVRIDQLKEGFLANKMAVYERLVALLVDMGEIVEAFNVAERSRARNFIDLLGNQRLTLRGTVEQDLYNRQRTLRSRIQEHEALLAQAPDDGERKVYQKALDRLTDDYEDLMLEIQAKNPQLATLVSVDPLEAPQVQALLEPGVALLAYYVTPEEILCWIVRPDGIELFRTPMGRASLRRDILDYRRMTQNLEPLEPQSKALFSRLIQPALPKLEDVNYLGIVPHGFLHYLSFATLTDGRDYLIDRHALFYIPSASVLRYTLDRRVERKNVRVLAVANPDLGHRALDLPFAEREVGSIRWNFPRITVLTRERATESWVAEHVGDFGIIHMASHGEFDPINPLFSAVKLAGDDAEDGNLEAIEVFDLQLNADLVVLSACQTGLGKVSGGDEIVGLNRSFFYAGTHALISSLWLVSDVSTAMLVKQFYRQYTSRNKADSLRKAALHTRYFYPHPSYWGAFILVGDYF